MINKDIDQINEEDLQELINNEIPEGKKIDYKQKLSGSSDKERKEFLADVTSFSNASGGYLIYGMIEKCGIPKDLVGLNIDDPEAEINKMENIIKQGISPRIPNVHIRQIKLLNSKHAIIIKIGKSWISPHRVTLKGHDKFYSRISSGKFPMDVSDLRTAFTLNESLNEKIKNFRVDRISKIEANEAPIMFDEDLKIVIHLIPIEAIRNESYDLSEIENNRSIFDNLLPIRSSGLGHHYNFDGFLIFEYPKEESYGYVQLFRNGIIESVSVAFQDDKKWIQMVYNEDDIIHYVSSYLEAQKNLGIDTPILIFLTLTGVKGYSMSSRSRNAVLIDRDTLILPDVIVENYNDEIENILKPVFDTVWNACGFEKSLNYDQNGKRIN